MNEQLQQAVASLIEKSLKAFEAGADFMADQLPDVVQQLLMWHMTLGAVKAVAALVFAGFLITLDIWAFRWNNEYAKKNHDEASLVLGWGVIGCFIRLPAWVIIVFGMWNLTWLQIWIAPKIFLIEYAASMMTK